MRSFHVAISGTSVFSHMSTIFFCLDDLVDSSRGRLACCRTAHAFFPCCHKWDIRLLPYGNNVLLPRWPSRFVLGRLACCCTVHAFFLSSISGTTVYSYKTTFFDLHNLVGSSTLGIFAESRWVFRVSLQFFGCTFCLFSHLVLWRLTSVLSFQIVKL